jgi:hypothetical protein
VKNFLSGCGRANEETTDEKKRLMKKWSRSRTEFAIVWNSWEEFLF